MKEGWGRGKSGGKPGSVDGMSDLYRTETQSVWNTGSIRWDCAVVYEARIEPPYRTQRSGNPVDKAWRETNYPETGFSEVFYVIPGGVHDGD